MNVLSHYMLTLFTAALVCGILGCIGKETGFGGLIRLSCGVYLMLTLITPFASLSFEGISPFSVPYTADALQASQSGEIYKQNAIALIIKQKTEAYILDKASSLPPSVQVDVSVSNDPVPIPVSVRVCGSLTSEQRQQLEAVLTNDLNIAKENQTWIG